MFLLFAYARVSLFMIEQTNEMNDHKIEPTKSINWTNVFIHVEVGSKQKGVGEIYEDKMNYYMNKWINQIINFPMWSYINEWIIQISEYLNSYQLN